MNSAFRDFLYRGWDTAARVAMLQEEYVVLDSSCKSMTARYDKIGGSGGGGGNAKDGGFAARGDLLTRINREKQKLADAESEMTQFCTLLQTRDAQILRYRYILRLPWGSILKAMQVKGYSCSNLRTLFYWHTKALDRAESIWEENYAVAYKREPERCD